MQTGVVGIIIQGDRSVAGEVQSILSAHADIILARTGIPDNDRNIYVISVIVRGSNERISSLSGKLGRLACVRVKSAVVTIES